MKLADGWFTRFDDNSQRAKCWKQVHRNARTVTHQWRDGIAKAVDEQSGIARSDDAARLPPLAKAALVAEFQRRYG